MKKLTSIILTIMMVVTSFAGFGTVSFAAEEPDEPLKTASTSNDGIISVSAGGDMAAVVRADGTAWTWGLYDYGNHYNKTEELGMLGCSTSIKCTPQMITSKNAQTIVCSSENAGTKSIGNGGYRSVCNSGMIDTDGSLWVWGGFRSDYVGSYGAVDSYYEKPTKILENVVCYDSDGDNQGAVTADGSLYMWGDDASGQLGLGTETETGSKGPVKVMDGVASVALGDYFSVILKKDGSVWTCGTNGYGQLGIGEEYKSGRHSTPTKILDNIVQVAAGEEFGGALSKDGKVYTWGSNSNGQLGTGSSGTAYTPVAVSELSNISCIEFGQNHAGALDSSGNLYMWGCGSAGQLGDNSCVSECYSPELVLKNVKMFSAGNCFTLAAKKDGTLWSWGSNHCGVLGQGEAPASYYQSISGKLNYSSKPLQVNLGTVNADFYVEDPANAVKKLSITWDETDLHNSPSEYNTDLATAGAVLSNQFEDGISQLGFRCIDSKSTTSISQPGYAIGYRVLYDFGSPSVEIIMAIRGTSNTTDIITDIKSTTDGFAEAGQYCFNQLKEAKSDIVGSASKYGVSVTKSNTRYFITGHSLGAACANLVCLKLISSDTAMVNKVYGYTYASPNYVINAGEEDSVPGLFNIINRSGDFVPYVPSTSLLSRLGLGVRTGKTGTIINYYPNDGNAKFMTSIYNLYGCYMDDKYGGYRAHMMPVYLSCVLSGTSKDTVAKVYSRLISVHCPVDVQVLDEKNNIVAYTSGEEVVYDNVYTPVTVMVDGDEKYVEILDQEKYTIKYIGTDEGTMNIEDQIIDTETDEVTSEKEFEDVSITEGKIFTSKIDASDEDVSTKLFVVDDDGDKISKVNADGTETPLKIDSLTLKSLPDKTTYIEGEKFDKNGLVVEANFSDGSTQTIDDYVLSNTGTNKIGNKNVTVYYKGVTETFTITVLEKSITDIAVTLPDKTVYVTGEEFDPTGMVVTANYNNGKSEEVTDYTVSGFGESEEANIITVTYKGNTKSFIVTIHNPEEEWTETTSATCTTDGEKTLYCADCGEPIKTKAIKAEGHQWGEWISVSSPNCTEKGNRKHICQVDGCGVEEFEDIDATDHNFDTEYTIDKEATCTEAGSKSKHCLNAGCDAVTDVTAIEPGHKEKKELVKATTEADGHLKITCTECRETISDTEIKKISNIELLEDSFTYDGTAKTPEVLVTDSINHKLEEGTDYDVEYKSNINGGTGKAVITFKGNYDGTIVKNFTIAGKALDNQAINLSASKFTYNGEVQRPKVLIDGLKQNQDFEVSFSDPGSTEAGKYTVTITGTGNCKGKEELSYMIEKYNIGNASIQASGDKYEYSGAVLKPEVTVTGFEEGRDYSVSYSNANSTNPGDYTVTVNGIGNCEGSKIFNYNIYVPTPEKTAITKLSAASKAFTAYWTKKTGITGYQLRYSLKSSMSGSKTVTIKGATASAKKITKLSKKKYYYVQVQTYRTVAGKTYYSGWSAAKKVKTK